MPGTSAPVFTKMGLSPWRHVRFYKGHSQTSGLEREIKREMKRETERKTERETEREVVIWSTWLSRGEDNCNIVTKRLR